jgi:hypothetical protein
VRPGFVCARRKGQTRRGKQDTRLTGKPEGRRHLTVGNGVGGLWKDERVAEKQTTISAAAGGPLAALVAQDTAGQTAPSETVGGKE